MKPADIRKLVDRLGVLKAQIAPLETEADEISAKLKALGLGKFEGSLWDALAYEQERTCVDWKAFCATKRIKPQALKPFTSKSTSVCLKVSARDAS